MVGHEAAGQPVDEERRRVEEHPRSRVYVRPVALEPQDLRANGLRSQRVATVREDAARANACGQILDLAGRARVYAIKHSVHERRALGVDGQHARANRARANGLYLGSTEPAIGEKLSTKPDEVAPPILIGAMLSPARARHDELMWTSGACQHPALAIDENALQFIGPDVNSEGGVHSG